MATTERSFPTWLPFVGMLGPQKKREPWPWLKPGIFLGGIVPITAVLVRASQGLLGANPIAQVENELGLTALVFLISSLVCTPARRIFGWTWAIRIRRELGLFAFFYALAHFLLYLTLDQFFDWWSIFADIAERPFITVGFLALVLMTPLALTSTNDSIKRLGYRKWVRLHQLVYLAGGLAVLHFIWRVKIDFSQPLVYALILAVLLGIRGIFWLRRPRARRAT
jgi:methionine sulfoxide reductase heme-binding subunit